MNKIIITILLSLFVFVSCENIPSDVIETAEADFKLVSLSAPPEFVYTQQDSTFETTIEFSNPQSISRVWFNIITEDGTTMLKQNVAMIGGSLTPSEIRGYYGSTILGKGIPTGKYIVEYYVEDNIGAGNDKVHKIASHNFLFISGQQNKPPVISNLIAPDSVVVVAPRSLINLHIKVEDENGLLDIREVYFLVFGPGSTTGNKVNMFDDGKEANGDDTAGDGIFSRIIEVTPTNTKGEYRFEFEAVDRAGAVSNKIIHLLQVI
ncbi:MAG TPA: hypothetical protein ENN33_05765 [Ignavibacteria bacterium]|nr:hypothetical protein [Ignavibacteria bacterium]